MADGDDLPDHDYASIYGHAALHARHLHCLAAMIARQRACIARLDAVIERMEARERRVQARLDARSIP